MLEGSRYYSYAYIVSSVLDAKVAYNITDWKEYDPEGGAYNSSYNGIELQLVQGTDGKKDVVYFYEQNLQYTFSKEQRKEFRDAGFIAVNFSWNA